jgi:hypothetical protein
MIAFSIATRDGQNARVQALTIENIARCDIEHVDHAASAQHSP